ncbi:MAG: ankyrin repeat domain-containing protein [Phycisphaerae bacterium]|nr:ankyrin repeat domain-containing protein [Phycisphaerae bacterium]
MNRDGWGIGLCGLAVVSLALLAAQASAGPNESSVTHQAIAKFDLAGLRASLAAQPESIDSRGADGQTLLQTAVRIGAVREAELLIESGADVRAVDAWGRSALHYAAMENQSALITRLVAAGADVGSRDVWGETPLQTAARRLQIEAAESLLEAGANVSAVNDDGRTALHLAVDQGSCRFSDEDRMVRFVSLLLGAGADAAAIDAHGSTAHAIAVARGYGRTAAFLDTRGGKIAGEVPPAEASLSDGNPTPEGLLAAYRTYAEIGPLMLDIETNYPTIAKRYDLGLSVQGRHLWAMRLSDNVTVEEDEPEMFYISTMHGDEIVGMENCLQFIEYLTGQNGIDSRATDLVNNLDLWILPLMNPDGYDRVSKIRYNANGVDLNRNFPDPFTSPNNTTAGRQAETAVVMNWAFGRYFVLGANLHGGELVVNYPYDNNPGGDSVFTRSPDEDSYVPISESYSIENPPMWSSPSFYHGITNGAAWYSTMGGLQDWGYRYMNSLQTVIELSLNKQPPSTDIPLYWNNNRDAMFAYAEWTLEGIRGIVTDRDSGLPIQAAVRADGRAVDSLTDPSVGNYHRILNPGTYGMTVSAAGYDTVRVEGISVNAGGATRVDVAMGGPAAQVQGPDGGESLELNTPVMIQWTGDASAQFQVQHTTDYGVINVDTDDFESGVLGPQYATGGQSAWLVTSSSSHGGAQSVRAGAIGNDQNTWLSQWVEADQVSFWYRVSTESGYDFFQFYVDGESRVRASGNVNWTSFSTALSPGPHLLLWEYAKDGSATGGSDTVWVDDIQIQKDDTAWQDVVPLTGVGDSSTSWTPTTETTTGRVRVRAFYGDGAYGQWDVSGSDFTVEDTGGVSAPLAAGAPHDVTKERYISFVPNNANPVAFEVALDSSVYFPGSVGTLGWVDVPDVNGVSRISNTPVFRTWSEPVLHVGDCPITPAAAYSLRATTNGTTFSAPLFVNTTPVPSPRAWGDVVGAPSGGVWPAPDGTVSGFDISAGVQAFQQLSTAPHFTRVDVNPAEPDSVVNGADILQVVRAFQLMAYPFPAPADCP